TGRGLDQHRVGEGGRVGVDVVRRDHGYAGGDGDLAGGVLAAHRVHHVAGRADQCDTGCLEGTGEDGPLGEEPVAGVHRVGARLLRRGHDGVDVEVAGHLYGHVGGADVRGVGVDRGVDRDGADAERGAGAEDAQGDLAAVGDEEGLD